jgi:GntR family transcriptional repressor for pyruvate dehydrogenase complex
MPLRAADTTRLYQQVAQQMEERIRAGEFKVGNRLPAERTLISHFGVSRSVLREALIVLELKGLVDIRVGAGTFVVEPRDDSAVKREAGLSFDDAGPFDILMARRMLETETARLAALTAAPDDLARIKAALDQIEQDTAPFVMRHVADRAFHIAIARATRNPALVTIVSGLWDRYRRFMISEAGELARRPENRGPAVADHLAIYTCLVDRDGNGAAAAMQAHLDRVSAFLSSFRKRPPTPVGGS